MLPLRSSFTTSFGSVCIGLRHPFQSLLAHFEHTLDRSSFALVVRHRVVLPGLLGSIQGEPAPSQLHAGMGRPSQKGRCTALVVVGSTEAANFDRVLGRAISR
jgi:hypothetical protein